MSRCVLLLWAAVLAAQEVDLKNPRTSSADVAQGEKTFRSHCSPCHGLKAEGGRGPNLAAGEAVFARAGCAGCHRVNGSGGRMGPDLSAIGKTRSAEYLRQSILDPDADVRQRYWVVRLTDSAGKSSEGFLMNEDTYTVQFIDLSGSLHSTGKADLKSYRVDKTSKMPSFNGKLSGDQVNQLVAYLSSLRPAGGGQ